MEIMYQVIWHEENQTGVPEHVMGASPLFRTEEEAQRWIDSSIAEDEDRAEEAERPALEIVRADGDKIVMTEGNCQRCFYHIETVEHRNEAAELLEKADACIDDVNRIVNDNAGDPDCSAAVNERLVEYYYESQRKTFRVDIRCSPCVCIRVKARTAEEAETIVNDRLDNGTLVLTAEQKSGIVSDILENVETVEAEEDT